MDRSECKAIVEREIEPMMERLGIPHWRLQVSYGPIPSDDPEWETRGEVTVKPNYNQAMIRLNPDAFDDETALLKTLRHELFHVVLTPYDVFIAIVKPLLTPSEAVESMATAAWRNACEQAVINLERMHHGLTERKPEPAPGPSPIRAD